MKKLLLFPVLSATLLLTACGGGSGGNGGIEAPQPATVPSNTRQSNLAISSIIDNESRRSAHILKTLGQNYYGNNGVAVLVRGASQHGNGNNICKSERDCNDIAFNNMKQWLIDNADSFNNWTDNQALRQALILAGFRNDLPGNWDDIKAWAIENHDKIVNQAQEIWNEMGEHRDFDITQSDFTVVDTHNDYPHKIVFQLDDDNKINKIQLKTETGSVYEHTMHGTRNNDSTRFSFNDHVYYYKLTNVGAAFDPASNGRRNIDFESATPITDINTLKQKLREIADWELARGEDGFFGSFHDCGGPETCVQDVYDATIAQINALTSMDDEHLEMDEYTDNFTADLESYGKTVGLAYSDFGKMIIHNEDGTGYMPYHGGYNNHKVSDERMNQLAQNIETDMTFTGKAVGVVNARQVTNWDGDVVSEQPDLALAGNATLNFRHNGSDTGTETLNMAFNNWYNVSVTKNGNDADITFSDYTNPNDNYKFVVAGSGPRPGDYTVTNFTGDSSQFDTNEDGVTGHKEGALKINYYAVNPNSNPSEASGFVAYSESEPMSGNEGDVINHVQFISAFGGTRQY